MWIELKLFFYFIQNVQLKSIMEIARELNMLQDKGSKGQLGLSDLTGGTFSISNIGIVSILNTSDPNAALSAYIFCYNQTIY